MAPMKVFIDADGSSPRPWGTPPGGRRGTSSARFIPTPVGNTGAQLHRHIHRSVHPHARGEHSGTMVMRSLSPGSSPRPWGTPRQSGAGRRGGRFIPTPVGNTSRPRPERLAGAVHPHARGEHRTNAGGSTCAIGSSPRPWGTRDDVVRQPNVARFIPTPVGNTGFAGARRPAGAVHPHARGEHRVDWLASLRSPGSSPRPWGTPGLHLQQDGAVRFIPTPVGNTCRSPRWPTLRAVHPHARGEHWIGMDLAEKRDGSSPRPWGTHFLQLFDSKGKKCTQKIYRVSEQYRHIVKEQSNRLVPGENSPAARHQSQPACAGSGPGS